MRSLLSATALCTLSLGAVEQSNAPADADRGSLVSLADSVTPLKERFNAKTERHRVVALLSPT